MILQSTAQFSPRRRRLTLTHIETEQLRKKNGEKPLFSNDFSVHPLTFFSIKLLFFGLSCDAGYLSSQLDFCLAVPTTRSRVLQQSGYVKIMVRIHFVLTILQFVCSRFFQLNCYFWAIARSMISQPTDGFEQCRCGRPFLFITTERRRKNNGENLLCFDDFSVILLTFFSIKMLFSGYCAIRDITADRWIFVPPLTPLDRVHQLTAALQKER